MEHVSVLLEEAISALNIKKNGIYVDATLGGAGHSSRILSSLTEGLDIHYVLYNKYEKYKEPYDLYVYYCNNEYENTNSSSNSGDGSSSNNGNEQEYYDSSNSSSSSGNEYISDVGILISANEVRNKNITGWHVLDNWPYSTLVYVTPKE